MGRVAPAGRLRRAQSHGDWFWAAFLINGPIVLTAHSIIISWLWSRTGRSTLVAFLYTGASRRPRWSRPTTGTQDASGLLGAGIGVDAMWLVAASLLAFRLSDFAISGKDCVTARRGKGVSATFLAEAH